LIAIAGFILIAVGIFFALRFLNINPIGGMTEPPPTPAPEATMQAVFAIRDVPMGTVLSAEDVKMAEIPIKYAPRDIVGTLEEAIGKISKTDMVEGEMLLKHYLVDPTGVSSYDVAYILDDNHVLMAMPATDLMSREVIIKRGDIVDIMVSIQESLETVTTEGEPTVEGETPATETTGPQQITFTVSQRLGISAIVIDIVQDPNAQTPPEDPNPNRNQVVVQAYLIALNPQDALVLKYLKDIGGIFEFVIRAPTSTGQFELTPVTSEFIKELYGLDLLP
jgi:pilus assembly protein CpaB